MKKMLVLDLDGTSITDNYILTDELLQAIHHLKNKHMVYIATGRSVSDAYQYYKAFHLDNDLICHNGGLIYNPNKDTVRQRNIIDNSKNIIQFILENQEEYKINNVVLSRCNETYLLSHENVYLHEIIVNRELPFYYVGDQLEQIHDVQRIIISISPEFCHILQAEVSRLFDNTIICSWRARQDIIDISVGSVDKWLAIKHIAQENDVMVQDIIAFGDARNDVTLLQNSGSGVCMKNGVQEAKDAADYITDYDNNENGVFHFIRNTLPGLCNFSYL